MPKPNPTIVLVGMMGSGKSTLGKQLARRLRRTFFDSDAEIVRRTGASIAHIFEVEGEPGFRKRESEELARLIAQPNVVLATGGGAVLTEANRRLLRAGGVVVYLHASVETLYDRTRHSRDRPLLAVPDPKARLMQLYAARDPLYRETAHAIVESDQSRLSDMVSRLLQAIARAEKSFEGKSLA